MVLNELTPNYEHSIHDKVHGNGKPDYIYMLLLKKNSHPDNRNKKNSTS